MPNIEGAQKAGLQAMLYEGQREAAEKFVFNGRK
jgi:hypothetical protein